MPYGIVTLDEMERSSTNGAVDRIHNYRIESVPFGIFPLDEMERCSTNGAVDRIHDVFKLMLDEMGGSRW